MHGGIARLGNIFVLTRIYQASRLVVNGQNVHNVWAYSFDQFKAASLVPYIDFNSLPHMPSS